MILQAMLNNVIRSARKAGVIIMIEIIIGIFMSIAIHFDLHIKAFWN